MRKLLLSLSPLLLAISFVLVYTLQSYLLCSCLYLFAWLLLLFAAVYGRSRRLLRFGAICWALTLLGFLLALLFPVAEPPLPAGLASLWRLYRSLFLLPLAGLPMPRAFCLPLSLFMLALHWPAHRYVKSLEVYIKI